jgi:hypothetical protein
MAIFNKKSNPDSKRSQHSMTLQNNAITKLDIKVKNVCQPSKIPRDYLARKFLFPDYED